jgi:hypothetical protein
VQIGAAQRLVPPGTTSRTSERGLPYVALNKIIWHVEESSSRHATSLVGEAMRSTTGRVVGEGRRSLHTRKCNGAASDPRLEVLERRWDDTVTASTPVAIVSADATQGHVQRDLAKGALAYLTKPHMPPQFDLRPGGRRNPPVERYDSKGSWLPATDRHFHGGVLGGGAPTARTFHVASN